MTHAEIPPAPGHTYAKGIHGRLLELRHDGFTPNRVLDVGANQGQSVVMFRSVWPEVHVTSIEAMHQCLPYLEMLADVVHNVVVSDCEKTAVFYVHAENSMSPGNSLYPDELDYFGKPVPFITQTTTLDKLFANAEPFDIIKLDIQGAELEAIRGGTKTISQAQYVICEMQVPPPANVGAPTKDETEAAILRLGFGEPMLLEWWLEKDTGRRINEDWIYRRL